MQKIMLIGLLFLMTPDINAQDLVSASRARKITLIHTLVPTAIGASAYFFDSDLIDTIGSTFVIYGLGFAPSIGQFMQDDWGKGSLGIGVRVLGAGVVSFGIYQAFSFWSKKERNPYLFIWSGIAIGAAGVIWSIVDLKQLTDNGSDYRPKIQFMLPAVSFKF